MDVTGGLHTFSFPLLKNAEILTCLSEAGIALTESELMEPQRHRDRVKSTFCSLVHLGLGHNEEHFITLGETLSQQVMSNPNLAHKELHADASSLSELKFFLACKKFMRICGIASDFGMSDLSSPTSKRFRKQLSAAINFIKFREEKLEVYAELQEQRDDILNGLNDVQEEQVALQQTLDQAKEDATQRWGQVQEVEREVSELEKEISTQNKHQSSIRQESTLLKKQAKDLKDKMDTTKLELAKLESHERKLLPQIVHSPKEIQSKLLALKQSLMEERKECDAAKRQAQIRNAKVTQIGQGIHLVNKLKEELSLVGEEQEKLIKVQQDCQVIQDVVDKNEAKTAELKEGCSVQERELQYIEEKTSHAKKQAKLRMDAAQAALHAASGELLIFERQQREAVARVQEGEEEVELLKALMEEERIKTEQEIEDIMLAYRKMEQVVLSHQKEFDAALGLPPCC